MIPGDLAARLRLLTEASFFADEPPIGPLQPTRPVPSQLPDYRPGDRFTAQIQKALPDGTFEALVDGKTIKLALPQNARAGETLELVVARQTPRAVLANPAPAAPASSGANTALSQTGRLISFLLTGQPAPEVPRLAGGQPLVSANNVNANTLAPALRQAITESGLFYESQQTRWVAGQTPTESLLRQPQGQQSPVLLSPLRDTQSAGTSAAALQGAATRAAEASAATQSQAATASAPASANRVEAVADRLMPVVHQQLDALATHHYAWQTQVWPGQDATLEIEDPDEGSGGDDDSENAAWKTTLRLTLPHLGGVQARLALDSQGIRISLDADSDGTVRTLADQRATLAAAMDAASIPVKELQVSLRDEPAGR